MNFYRPLKIPNKTARHLAIHCSGLTSAPTLPCNKDNLLKLIKYLGYVQQDPIQVVARAHDHILWSRNTNYRPQHLESLHHKDRLIFEHFCHDACVLPMDTLPYWKHQFHRKNKLFTSNRQRNNLLSKADQKKLISRIENEGPLCSRDFKINEKDKQRATWSKPAHKQTLDYLWLTGGLAVSKREKFTKYYDLAERIYPGKLIDTDKNHNERLTWFITKALKRLGYGTFSEITRFWDISVLDETKQWCQTNMSKLREVSVESANGDSIAAVTLATSKALHSSPPSPSKRLRIINPFDPLIRDRKRLTNLFDFDYRIEMYVPPAKRSYGYYVYPLLEYDTFVGRLEVRHDRESNIICVDNLWREPGIRFGKQRMEKLRVELERLKRFCSADSVAWSK